jgi:hypothetical protein
MTGADGTEGRCAGTAAVAPAVSLVGLAGIGVGAMAGTDRGVVDVGIGTGLGVIATGTGDSPRKSFTRVSTSWLIEMLLASQNAFSRS